MKLRYLSLLLISAVFSCALAENYVVETGQFEKLKVNGNVSIIYKNLPDSTGFARYQAPEGCSNIFLLNNKNDGILKVQPADDQWGSNQLPVLYIYSDFLTSVESYSERDVTVESIAPCASFTVNLIGNGSISVENVKCNNLSAAITTGNGQITLSGSCINANLRMLGAGLISADRLQADNVKCKILGTGSIGCWPVDNLKVTGLGTTKIYYKGSPDIKKTGGGKLFQLPEEEEEENGLPRVEVKSFNPPVSAADSEEIEEDEDFDDPDEDEASEADNEDSEDYETVVTEDD